MSGGPFDLGGPAFPVIAENGLGHISDGMSLRDWFAGQAMPGLMHRCLDEELPREAYRIADLMLAERAKESK